MITLMIVYAILFIVALLKSFYYYYTLPFIKSVSIKEKLNTLYDFFQWETTICALNQGKINLFVLALNFIILLFFNIIFLHDYCISHCAGVPKLIDDSVDELEKFKTQTRIITNDALNNYENNNINKNLLKYIFQFLKRKENFFESRDTIIEINKIINELHLIHNNSISAYQSIITSFQENSDLFVFYKNLQGLYYENLFKLIILESLNEKLSIPIYEKLFNYTFINEVLYNFLASKINPNIVSTHISPFLDDKKLLDENNNYFNTKLSIVNNQNSLMILKPDKTVQAQNVELPNLIFHNYPILEIQKIDNEIVSKIIVDGKIIEVTDIEVRAENPNGRQGILKGGIGIIESYTNLNEFLLKTKTTLNYLNMQIDFVNELIEQNDKKSLSTALEILKLQKKEEDFIELTQYRIIDEKVIQDPNNLFPNSNSNINDNTLQRMEAINKVFLKSLNKNIKILKDINTQKSSNMEVDYQKLIENINNPKSDGYFFTQKMKNQIIQASKNEFSNKRHR